MLITTLAGTRLRIELDRVPLWRGDQVSVRQLIEDFARYIYLPRLTGPQVLLSAIADGLTLFTWEQESFGYADSYDEASGRFRGLRAGQPLMLADPSVGLLVKSEIARRQLLADAAARNADVTIDSGSGVSPQDNQTQPGSVESRIASNGHLPKRFHGTVNLDPTRLGRDAGRISDEVVAHLVGLVGANVNVTLEISADVQNGVPDNVVRTVTENCRTLKFKDHGFEES